MVGKLLRMEGDKFRYGWKKSDMVGKLLRIQGGNNWKYSHMVGKGMTWSENYSGWKATNSNMVGNFPQGVRKGVPSHRTFSLSHPSYRWEFPIPFSISVGLTWWKHFRKRWFLAILQCCRAVSWVNQPYRALMWWRRAVAAAVERMWWGWLTSWW